MTSIPLVKNERLDATIYRCPNGVIHISLSFVDLRLTDRGFYEFAQVVNKAVSALIGEHVRGSACFRKGEKEC